MDWKRRGAEGGEVCNERRRREHVPFSQTRTNGDHSGSAFCVHNYTDVTPSAAANTWCRAPESGSYRARNKSVGTKVVKAALHWLDAEQSVECRMG